MPDDVMIPRADDSKPETKLVVTTVERWWQRSAVHSAIFSTFIFIVGFLRKWDQADTAGEPIRPLVIDLIEQIITVWGSAFGVTAGQPGLRRAALILVALIVTGTLSIN